MNIAFFLVPKSEVVYLYHDMSLVAAMEIMRKHRFQALPVLDEDGKYFGVLTEGDVLWALEERGRDAAPAIVLGQLAPDREYQPVRISEDMDRLIGAACSQSFVPVIDDSGVFIGLIKRADIIRYYYYHSTLNAAAKAGIPAFA